MGLRQIQIYKTCYVVVCTRWCHKIYRNWHHSTTLTTRKCHLQRESLAHLRRWKENFMQNKGNQNFQTSELWKVLFKKKNSLGNKTWQTSELSALLSVSAIMRILPEQCISQWQENCSNALPRYHLKDVTYNHKKYAQHRLFFSCS